MADIVLHPRAVRPVPNPFGLYVHVGRNDHLDVANALLTGRTALFGIVIDALNNKRQAELRSVASDRRLDVVLDTRTLELSTPNGFDERSAKLPWAGSQIDTPATFSADEIARRAEALAKALVGYAYSAVLAPSHLIDSATSPWLEVDGRLTKALRLELDAAGRLATAIMYPLVLQGSVFRDQAALASIARRLSDLPIDAVWLTVNGFGSSATPAAFIHGLTAGMTLEQTGVPTVVDKVGGVVGLGLLAFGAAGGIAHGVTLGERYSLNALLSERTGKGFSPAPRVYVPDLDMMLKKEEAKALFHAKGALHRLACRDGTCCPRGFADTLDQPRRHFLNQRSAQVTQLSQVPSHLRADRFLEGTIRPISDNAAFAERLNVPEGLDMGRLSRNRKRLDNFRQVLAREVERRADPPQPKLPSTRVRREGHR